MVDFSVRNAIKHKFSVSDPFVQMTVILISLARQKYLILKVTKAVTRRNFRRSIVLSFGLMVLILLLLLVLLFNLFFFAIPKGLAQVDE